MIGAYGMRPVPFLLAAALSVLLTRPPAPAPADAPEGAFSAARAFRHVEEIAKEPHPLGSEANDRVRAYLISRLDALDVPVSTHSLTPAPDSGLDWTLTNLRAEIPGTDPTGTVILCSHYDARDDAPGAGDAAAGVAAILEALRALRAGPPLRNDLIVLFTDGEEAGLLGARLAARNLGVDPARAVVLNLEGRGNAGPVYMFQTSRPNGFVTRAFLRASPRPAANSLMAAVYERMPNDTDLTIFMGEGLRGLNFAMIEGYPAYHTPLDTPGHLDRRSLQHHGEHVLATARELGSADLGAIGDEQVVYFDVLGRFALVYPEWLAWPLAALALLLVAAAVRPRPGRPGAGRMLAGLAVVLGVTALATALGYGLTMGARAVVPRGAEPDLAFLAIAVLTGGGTYLALRLLSPRIRAAALSAGALGAWAALLLASTAILPAASFLFLIPAAAGALALLFPRAAPLLVVPVAILVAPLATGMFHAMTLRAAWLPVPLVALTVAVAWPGLARSRSDPAPE